MTYDQAQAPRPFGFRLLFWETRLGKFPEASQS